RPQSATPLCHRRRPPRPARVQTDEPSLAVTTRVARSCAAAGTALAPPRARQALLASSRGAWPEARLLFPPLRALACLPAPAQARWRLPSPWTAAPAHRFRPSNRRLLAARPPAAPRLAS